VFLFSERLFVGEKPSSARRTATRSTEVVYMSFSRRRPGDEYQENPRVRRQTDAMSRHLLPLSLDPIIGQNNEPSLSGPPPTRFIVFS
jgi:hypothetical protein